MNGGAQERVPGGTLVVEPVTFDMMQPTAVLLAGAFAEVRPFVSLACMTLTGVRQ